VRFDSESASLLSSAFCTPSAPRYLFIQTTRPQSTLCVKAGEYQKSATNHRRPIMRVTLRATQVQRLPMGDSRAIAVLLVGIAPMIWRDCVELNGIILTAARCQSLFDQTLFINPLSSCPAEWSRMCPNSCTIAYPKTRLNVGAVASLTLATRSA
jgi:hypothetical protein